MVAGLVLQRFVLTLPIGLPKSLARFATWGALAFAAGFMVSAVALFRRTGQDPKPWKSTPELVLKGPYRWTRNPMYLGMALFQAAVGLWFANGWILLTLPIVLVAIYLTAIRHEEAYLERKFGTPYQDYKSAVRRWL
jgi:protein-S-isoprenylcysteine O-methyltransferase Ste14